MTDITYYRYKYRAYTKRERLSIWWQNFRYHLYRAFFASRPPEGTRDLIQCEKEDAQLSMIADPNPLRFKYVNGKLERVK